MMVKHELAAISICPVNGSVDSYLVEVWFDKIVPCEQVSADVDRFALRTMYQEDLTQELSDIWNATVRTVGTHHYGVVRTECTCRPNHAVVPINPSGVVA